MSHEHNEYQRRYYSERESPRIGLGRADTPYVRRHLDEVIARLDLSVGSSVLDVGCGLGKYTKGLVDAGFHVEGMDLTPALISQMAILLPGVQGHVGDVAAPPAELQGRFDAVTGFFFLHHVGDLPRVLAGVRSCLVPGGRAVFLEPNPMFPGYYVQIAFTPGMTWRGERGILSMRPTVLERAARLAGFQSFDEVALGAFPPALANFSVGRRIEMLIERAPGWHVVGAFRLITMQ